jgi:hypothetical protein
VRPRLSRLIKDFEQAAGFHDKTEALARLLGRTRAPSHVGVLAPLLEAGLTSFGKSLEETELSKPDWQRYQEWSESPWLQGFQRLEGGTVLLYVKDPHGRSHALEHGKTGTRWVDFREAVARGRRHEALVLRTRSTPEMRLFAVWEGGSDLLLSFGDAAPVRLSKADQERLHGGVPLPPSHPLTAKLQSEETTWTVHEDAFLVRNGPHQMRVDRLLFGLAAAYPNKRFARDPLSEHTAERVRIIDTFRVADRSYALALIPDKAFRIEDGKALQNIQDELSRVMDVQRVRPGMGPIQGGQRVRLLIVISGHQSKEMAHLVRELGVRGAFRNALVVFCSCESPLTRALQYEITGRFGAVGVMGFEGIIKASQVETMLANLVEGLEAKGRYVPAASLLRESFRKSLPARPLNGIWTISRRPVSTSSQEDAHA